MTTAVLISGGVDSSVALRKLKEEGHDLHAFYLKVWLEEEMAFLGSCPWEEDLGFARAVCDEVDVPLDIVPLQQEYLERVVSYTIDELRQGRTPSPDIFCNQRIKFGAFLDHLGSQFQSVATGHYARIDHSGAQVRLRKGLDPVKDQTYFLSHLSRAQLERCLFPVGEYPKAEVRALAERYQLPNAARRDSQGICFLGKIRFRDFVKAHLGEQPGAIVELESGRQLGQHQGFWFHTLGQRRGLGLSQGPWFVVGKDVEQNVVYVSHEEKLEQSAQDRLQLTQEHWIESPDPALPLTVKLRHSEHVYACQLNRSEDRSELVLEGADTGAAPGQFAVFYHDDICLGGARIG